MPSPSPARPIKRIDRIQLPPGPHRLAVMAGAWGNIPALDACLRDAAAENCDAFAFLGDAVGIFGHSSEILETIRKQFPIRVAGDYEKQLVAGAGYLGNPTTSSDAHSVACLAYSRAVRELDDADRPWLASWPDAVLLDSAAGRLLLSHGTPDKTDEPLFESVLDAGRLIHWLDEYAAQALICAHTGIPWTRNLSSGRAAANCGAVGLPDHDADPAVHYLVVTADESRPLQFQMARVEYDCEPLVGEWLAQGLDPRVVEPHRTGIWTHGLEDLPPRERHRPEDRHGPSLGPQSQP